MLFKIIWFITFVFIGIIIGVKFDLRQESIHTGIRSISSYGYNHIGSEDSGQTECYWIKLEDGKFTCSKED